jgi:hypothetical protein
MSCRLLSAEIVVLVIAVALLIYAGRDKAARRPYREAGSVALGVYLGVLAYWF